MSSWITFTILAAFMQAIRTAGQKQLTNCVSPMSSTLIRYVFGLPFAIVYLIYLTDGQTQSLLLEASKNTRFLIYGAMAGIAQIAATFLLIKVFSFRNFTVGTSFAKTEAIQAAVLGSVLFASTLTPLAWLAVAIGFIGVFIVSIPTRAQSWEAQNVMLGTLSGTAFALTSLWLREASLSLNLPVLQSAAITLVCMVGFQALVCIGYTALREPNQLAAIRTRLGLATFVGLTSALGSIGWFTAMTFQNPAIVKSLGQIEFIFTLLLTTLFFKERVSGRELLGVVAIVASVILLLQSG